MKHLSERAIIQLLAQHSSTPADVFGIGDDAAVIHRGSDCEVITKDLLIEDQHFRLNYYSPEQLAKKALHVNLSDVAAMGATPQYILLGLSIPINRSADWLSVFLHCFKQECAKAKVSLIGGDTTLSPHGLMISITAIGHAQESHLKYRHGAQPRDLICVLGHTGGAYAGLLLLEDNIAGFEPLKTCLLSPTALVEEGKWLGAQTAVTAMLDTSDGIYIDLNHLCDASSKGAVLNIDQLPILPSLLDATRALNIDPYDCALMGGEDYGLLFTVKPEGFHALKKAFAQQFAIPLTAIGVITDTKKLALKMHNEDYKPVLKPFSHFKELD